MNTRSSIVWFARPWRALIALAAVAPRAFAEDPVPTTQPSFWQEHETLIDCILILVAVVAICYGVRLAIWLIRVGLTRLNAALGNQRFSVKRISTLLSFAGSIIKLFVWIFGVIAILKEVGVDPAMSTGAIGLIGLIMAGMFQQLVIDFVKGLDVVAGGHYNVGDFIEVGGKMGHVVDFSVKHTRLQTLSGQEYNLPNSQCVPSRRFPDGYVNNYVDLTLRSADDEAKANAAIEPICRDLNQRLEPVRNVPGAVGRFPGPGSRLTLRYSVRVLPGADWVVTDYFIPAAKQALAEAGVELANEPTFFFINRIETFRKLFNRKLTEEEILREAALEPAQSPPEDTSLPHAPDAPEAAT